LALSLGQLAKRRQQLLELMVLHCALRVNSTMRT
jgi:hypothetical protein